MDSSDLRTQEFHFNGGPPELTRRRWRARWSIIEVGLLWYAIWLATVLIWLLVTALTDNGKGQFTVLGIVTLAITFLWLLVGMVAGGALLFRWMYRNWPPARLD